MFLIELTLDSGLVRASNRQLALEHFWDSLISKFDDVQIGSDTVYGGYSAISFGSVELILRTFENDWPPPVSIPATIKYTATTEAAATTILEGTLHRTMWSRDGVEYKFFPPLYDTTVTDQEYSSATSLGTLTDIFTWACNAARLNLTYDGSATSRGSTAVKYTSSGERILIADLHDIAKFFCHGFYILEDRLYLVDMLADNGTDAMDEFDYYPSSYPDTPPTSLVKCTEGSNDYHVDGSYSYGTEFTVSPVCHDTQANIDAALNDIKTLIEQPRAEVKTKVGTSVDLAKKITVTDESMGQSITAWLRAHTMTWNIDDEELIAEGAGGIS